MNSAQPTDASDSEALCVVIDCNQWIRLKWLGSPIGLTFLALLKRDAGLKLAIPEVLDGELDKHRAETAHTLLSRLKDAVAEVGTVMGDSLAGGIVMLTEEAIEVAIRQRLTGVAERTIYPELTLSHSQ